MIEEQKEKGVPSNNPAWEQLFEMLDTNNFTCADMVACVCATLCRYKDTVFETELMCGGYKWNVKIERKN